MDKMTSVLLMLLLLGAFVKSSQAIKCYMCSNCKVTSDTKTCDVGDVCFTQTVVAFMLSVTYFYFNCSM